MWQKSYDNHTCVIKIRDSMPHTFVGLLGDGEGVRARGGVGRPGRLGLQRRGQPWVVALDHRDEPGAIQK